MALITGGAGFVGTNLIKRLIESGHATYSIDNYSTGLTQNHQERCEYIYGDVSEVDWNQRHLPNGIEVVFHLAAMARIQPSFSNPSKYFTVNTTGTLNMINWCLEHSAPMIYAGTSSKHSGRFENPYTFSKDVGEDLIRLYEKHFNLKASIARFYNVYGPHQLLGGEYSTLIGAWMNNLENDQGCVVYGDGEQTRDFTHVEDVTKALALITEKEAYGHSFELGRGEPYSINEVARMFDIQPTYLEGKRGEARHTSSLSPDNDPTRKILGWQPEINLVDYINNYKKQ